MKLTKFEITNFRCFESLSITFDPDVNVIVGTNGAGKSALLDAIATSLFNVVQAVGDPESSHVKKQKVGLRVSDIFIAPGNGNVEARRKPHVELHMKAAFPPQEQKTNTSKQNGDDELIYWAEKIVPPIPHQHHKYWHDKQDLENYCRHLWRQLSEDQTSTTPLPILAYYRASRRIDHMPPMGDVFNQTLERPMAFRQALDAGSSYQAMCQWFYLRENEELRDKKHAPYPDLQAARQALIQTLEEVEEVFFSGRPPQLSIALTPSGKKRCETPSSDDDRSVMTLEQMSDGYRNLLAVVLDFARRLAMAHPHWKNPLTAPAVLLIDEIDLHLHPKWQQRIIPNLRKVFPHTQIIATTHSPQVLTTVHQKNIIILKDKEAFCSPLNTYGTESIQAMKGVMETDSRPPEEDNNYVRDIKRLFDLISQEKLTEAEELCQGLASLFGNDDPTLIEAETIIKNRQWEKEVGL